MIVMNKLFSTILILIVIISNRACGQEKIVNTNNPEIVGVQFPNFQGSIFGENYFLDPLYSKNGNYTRRFTPSMEDIKGAETIIAKNIDSAIQSNSYLLNTIPQINKHVNDYFRQYSGYLNDKEEKLIYLNCHWDIYTIEESKKQIPDRRLKYSSEYQTVMDGGSYYWQAIINLDTKQIVEFSVNGDA